MFRSSHPNKTKHTREQQCTILRFLGHGRVNGLPYGNINLQLPTRGEVPLHHVQKHHISMHVQNMDREVTHTLTWLVFTNNLCILQESNCSLVYTMLLFIDFFTHICLYPSEPLVTNYNTVSNGALHINKQTWNVTQCMDYTTIQWLGKDGK